MSWYTAYGNHDGMWQGNEPIDSIFFDSKGWATGGNKITGTESDLPDNGGDLGSVDKFIMAHNLTSTPVSADPERRLLSRKAFIQDHFNTAGGASPPWWHGASPRPKSSTRPPRSSGV